MKTMKSLFGIVALLILTAISANAQTPNQVVTQGTIKNYHSTTNHIVDGYSLGWSVTGTGNTLTPDAGANTSVTWNAAPGVYTLTLTETNTASGTCATPNYFYVEILGKAILQFSQATSSSCADESQSLTLTYKFENGNDITAANTSYFPFTVTYTVVDPLNASLTSPRTLTVNSPADLKIDLTATDRVDQDPYTVSRPLTVTLNDDARITTGNMFIELGAIKANVNTIFDVPELNPIVAE